MTEIPRDPPDDAPSLQAWVHALAEADPPDREKALRELEAPGAGARDEATWTGLLARLFPQEADLPPDSADARALQAALGELGLPPDEALSLLGDAFSHPPVQEAWAAWDALDDRDEVRARVAVLDRAEALTDASVRFLVFTLRSSDPVVYQPAALAAGRHLPAEPALQEALAAYVEERGVPLDAPIHLDDDRTRRRLLLVQAAARASDRPATGDARGLLGDEPPLPADLPDGPGPALPRSSADAGVLLVATARLHAAPDPAPQVREATPHLLAAVPDLDDERLTRTVVDAWCDLLAASPDPGASSEAALDLLERLAEVPDPPEGSLAAPARALLRLDELAAALPDLPPALAAELVDGVGALPDPRSRAIGLARAIAWARRAPGEAPPWADGAYDHLRALPDAALLLPLSAPAPSAGAEPGLDALRTLVPRIAASDWTARPPRERARTLFLALDALRNEDPPADRLRSLLTAHGLAPEAPGESPMGLLLEAVLAREPPGAAAFLDARLLHEAAAPRLLAALLDPDAAPLADPLADALENEVRVERRRDPAFDPLAFLARTQVRDPTPAVYEALAAVARDRTYEDPQGRDFPLAAVAEALARDARGPSGGPARWSDLPLDRSDALGPARDRLRERLEAVPDDGDPTDQLQRVAEAVGRTEGGRTPSPASVVGLLRAVHPRAGPLLARGRPAWRDRARVDVEEEVEDLLRRVEDQVAALEPRPLGDLADAPDPASAAAEALAELQELVAPYLPAPEARRLAAAVDAAGASLADWSRGVEALAAAWEGRGGGPDQAEALLDALHGAWDPPLRRVGLQVVLRTLDPGSVPDPYPLLAWAADAPRPEDRTSQEASAWRSWRRALWRRCLEDALAGERPARVRTLLVDPAYAAERAHPDARPLLDRARTWGYERYRVGPALAVERAGDPGGRTRAALRAVRGYLAHFSPVWLALVVGAILMLDFGDAWREMAAAGDVTGVAITAVLGVGGAFAYVLADLRARTDPTSDPLPAGLLPGSGGDAAARAEEPAPVSGTGDAPALGLASVGRAGAFVALCLVWALAVTAGLWWLLSGTDEVVHGAGAPLHVAVWAGFALFVGIFFGLVAKET